jgi:hypothetical protein
VPEPANSAHSDQAEVRHLPVLADVQEARPLERTYPRLPVPAPVAAAAGGFLAGVAAFVLVRVLRRPARAHTRSIRAGRGREGREVAASRSFLVDIHLLKR